YRSWVPIEGEADKLDRVRADSKTLNHLLDPAWLENNSDAIELLTAHFGFDELELRLIGLAPDPTTRASLRSQIAKLVESGGADPQIYAALAEQIQDQKRREGDVQKWRKLGLAVQRAVESALELKKLKLKFIDRGFDFEVTSPGDLFEEASS